MLDERIFIGACHKKRAITQEWLEGCSVDGNYADDTISHSHKQTYTAYCSTVVPYAIHRAPATRRKWWTRPVQNTRDQRLHQKHFILHFGIFFSITPRWQINKLTRLLSHVESILRESSLISIAKLLRWKRIQEENAINDPWMIVDVVWSVWRRGRDPPRERCKICWLG